MQNKEQRGIYEPFIDEKGAKIYEWQNTEKVRFRIIVDTIRKDRGEGDNCHSSTSAGVIITFYSDRNLKNTMKFKNPLVDNYYKKPNQIQEVSESNLHKRNRK